MRLCEERLAFCCQQVKLPCPDELSWCLSISESDVVQQDAHQWKQVVSVSTALGLITTLCSLSFPS